MRHAVFATVLWVIATPAISDEGIPEFAQDDPARIWIDGDAIYYFGAISSASQDVFLDFIANEDTSGVRRFVVNSLGGETTVGRVIGRWVFDAGLDVEVDAICFSSCADYIFPAGRKKTIQPASFVGWHGSEGQYDVIAQSMPGESGEALERQSLRAALRPVLPESASDDDIERAVDEQMDLYHKRRKEEAEFFDLIGVSSEFTLHGMRPGNIDAWRESGHPGWTYSLADMEKLGLGKIVFLGEGKYTASHQVIRNVFVAPYNPALVPDP